MGPRVKAAHTVKQWTFDYKSSVRAFKSVAERVPPKPVRTRFRCRAATDSVTIRKPTSTSTSYKKTGKWRPRFPDTNTGASSRPIM